MPDDFSLDPIPEPPKLKVGQLPPDPVEPSPKPKGGRPRKPRPEPERGPVLATIGEIEIRHPEDALVGDFVLCRGFKCANLFRKKHHREKFCSRQCRDHTNYRRRNRAHQLNGFDFIADLTRDLKRWEAKVDQEAQDRGQPRPETVESLIATLKQLDKPVPTKFLTFVEEES